MNSWYERINGTPPITTQSFAPMFQNPIQKAMYIMRTMTNPAAFVKQAFPDVPDEVLNDPNRILQFLQQSRGISNNQLQQIIQQYPRGY